MGKADENMSEENYRTALDLYREYRGMNITELANASGVSRQTVGSACKGELKLGEKRLRMLANALCVDPDDLDQDLDPGGAGQGGQHPGGAATLFGQNRPLQAQGYQAEDGQCDRLPG